MIMMLLKWTVAAMVAMGALVLSAQIDGVEDKRKNIKAPEIVYPIYLLLRPHREHLTCEDIAAGLNISQGRVSLETLIALFERLEIRYQLKPLSAFEAKQLPTPSVITIYTGQSTNAFYAQKHEDEGIWLVNFKVNGEARFHVHYAELEQSEHGYVLTVTDAPVKTSILRQALTVIPCLVLAVALLAWLLRGLKLRGLKLLSSKLKQNSRSASQDIISETLTVEFKFCFNLLDSDWRSDIS